MRFAEQFRQKIVGMKSSFGIPRNGETVSQVAELEKQLNALRIELMQVQARNDRLLSGATGYDRQFKSLEQQFDARRSAEQELRNIIAQMDQRLTAFDRDYTAGKQESHSLAAELDSIHLELDKQRNDHLEQLNGLQQRISDAESANVRLDSAHEDQHRITHKLHMQLQSLTAALEQVQVRCDELLPGVAEHGQRLEILGESLAARQSGEEEVRNIIGHLDQRLTAVDLDYTIAKQDSHNLAAEIDGIRTEFDSNRSSHTQQLTDLRQRIGDAESENTRLCSVQDQQSRLTEDLQTQLASLKTDLDRLQGQHNTLETQQAGYKSLLETLDAEDKAHRLQEQQLMSGIKSLEQRHGDIDVKLVDMRDQLKVLGNSLADTASRHGDVQQKVKLLEDQLEGQRKRHDTNINSVEERLASVRFEQEGLLHTQAEIAETVKKSRRWVTATAGIAFLFLVVLVSTSGLRETQEDIPRQAAVIPDSGQSPETETLDEGDPGERQSVAQNGKTAALETGGMPIQSSERGSGSAELPVRESQPAVADSSISSPGQISHQADPGELPGNAQGRQFEKSSQPADREVGTVAGKVLAPDQAAATAQAYETDAFFRENAAKKGVVSLPSGLQYKVLRQGQGKSPGPRDLVVLHYRGSLPDGKVFDSSYVEDAPAAYQVEDVIAGWREALLRMREGAKWELYIPPELGHITSQRGENDFLPRIYQIELISVSETGALSQP